MPKVESTIGLRLKHVAALKRTHPPGHWRDLGESSAPFYHLDSHVSDSFSQTMNHLRSLPKKGRFGEFPWQFSG